MPGYIMALTNLILGIICVGISRNNNMPKLITFFALVAGIIGISTGIVVAHLRRRFGR